LPADSNWLPRSEREIAHQRTGVRRGHRDTWLFPSRRRPLLREDHPFLLKLNNPPAQSGELMPLGRG